MKSKAEIIKNIALKIGNLPTMPTIVAKMIELADNPKTQINTLAQLISNDPSLTARILKSANSQYYGFSREISTVDTAIVVMGYKAVKEIGLSLNAFDSLKNTAAIKNFDIHEYLEHSVEVAVAARESAKINFPADSGELYVAGLLHDMGKMILIQYMPQDFCEVLDFSEKNNIPFFEAEQQLLGITHCEIGYIIAERWNLPQKIGNIIRFHHSPISAPDEFSAQAQIINTADIACRNPLASPEN